MARIKLNMSPEERRQYNNEMHKKQSRLRREKAEREALRNIVWEIVMTFEKLGWDKTDLVVGADMKMIEAVVDELIKEDKFKIVLGAKTGIKRKENK